MKRFLLTVSAVLAWSILPVNGQGGAGAVMREARVTQVVKDVKILAAKAEPRPATTTDTVRGDTAVRTGVESRAELTFGDLTIARLGANTIFSFNEGSRTVELGNGAILLRVPKGSAGTKIQTAAVTAAITGTTVIVEYHPDSYAKYLTLEGTMRVYLKGVVGESVLLQPGQMLIVKPNATRLPDPVDFDLERLLRTSLFIQGYAPLPSMPLMAEVQHVQLDKKASGELVDTNLVIFGRGTLVTLTDPQSLDVIDRKTAAVTLPTPTVAPPPPTPTATPTITPAPTPTSTPNPTPTSTPVPSPTATPTATPTGTPTPQPTPSKFGTPPVITSFVPYPIDNGTTIRTDPAITRAGVTDFGKIYRNASQDGPFSAWAFTATSPFDAVSGVDTLYGGVAVAAFKFVALQLTGNPTIDLSNGGAFNLALISVGPITAAAAGNSNFRFVGLNSVLIATQNGSIDTSSPNLAFVQIPFLIFYARGAGSNLTLAGGGIFDVPTLRLIAENNIQINAPESLRSQFGADGGVLRGTAGGSLTVNSPIETPTAFVTTGTSGNGGMISLSALGGTLTVNSRIQSSYNDPDPAVPGTSIRRSAQGGPIDLFSGLTSGTGISLTSGTSLLTLLNPTAPGPPGSITLFTAGSDIVTNNATLEADRGSIGIGQTATPPAGTAQITLNGGTISSESLSANSRGNLTVGTTTPVNISTVTLGLTAANDVTVQGLTTSATAVNSSGNVTLQAGNDLLITGPISISRFNGGVSSVISGLNLLLNAGRNLQVNGDLSLLSNASGLTRGGDVTVQSGGNMTIAGTTNLQTQTVTGDHGTGGNITIMSGGAISTADLFASATVGPGRTLTTGGNVGLTAASFSVSDAKGGLRLQVLTFSGGAISTGGNITLSITGDARMGSSGAFSLNVNNNNGGKIQTGGNINSTIGGNLTTNQVLALIDNRFGGSIGTGGTLTFNINGTLTTTGDANLEILNSQMGTTGGKIGTATFINATLGSASIGRDFNVFVDNSDGSIGPGGNDWTVTLQINGTLSVAGRLNVFGAITSKGAVTATQLSATNINAPSIAVGSGGITRFSYPNETPVNPVHTITTSALTSTGGINFNGLDQDAIPGFGPFDGGQLTLNVPSLTFGPSAANNIQGPVTFNGGASSNVAIQGGSGGTFTVNATGDITVGSPIQATTGLQPSSSEPGGVGGAVNLNSTGGTVSVSSAITVSSADPATGAPRRHSRAGGNINLRSDAGTVVAINVTSTGQLLSLLEAAAPGPGGKVTILATGADSSINITGSTGPAGGAPPDTIRADKGTVDIRHTGAAGSISLSNAQIAADTVKIGALGNGGTLTIGGGRITADTLLQLYATGSNGSVVFVGNVTLAGNSLKMIAGNTVTVNNGVTVQVSNRPAEVYVSDFNHANYSNFNGGNNSTSGRFIIEGTAGSPTSGANTHFGPPPQPPFEGGH